MIAVRTVALPESIHNVKNINKVFKLLLLFLHMLIKIISFFKI